MTDNHNLLAHFFSNGIMSCQSVFMLMTVQPYFFASS